MLELKLSHTQQLFRYSTGCRDIDAENVGCSFGREVGGDRKLYDVEGVRRAIEHYREKDILVIVVGKRSETQQGIPIDTKFIIAERTDDVIVLKESQRWNCPIVSRDSYDNCRQVRSHKYVRTKGFACYSVLHAHTEGAIYCPT